MPVIGTSGNLDPDNLTPRPSGSPTLGQTPVVTSISPLELGWGSGGAASVPGAIPDLSRWWQKLAEARAGGPSPVMVYVGDSTSVGANTFIDQLTYRYCRPGEPLEGLTPGTSTIVAGGNNGAGGIFWLGLTGSGLPNNFYPQDVIDLNPDLIVLSFGINDVRTGGANLTQMKAFLANVITWQRANLPNACLVLRMPNCLGPTDFGPGYVSPNSSAQAYTDILWRAYSSVRDEYPDVTVIDMMTRIFGRTSKPANIYLGDQLHPSSLGYAAIVDEVVKVIGLPQYPEDNEDRVTPYRLRNVNKITTTTKATVSNKSLTSNVATLATSSTRWEIGETIIVAIGDPVFDGTQVVTAASGSNVSYAKTNANVASAAASGTVRSTPPWIAQPSVLDDRRSYRLLCEMSVGNLDVPNNRIFTQSPVGGTNNDAALVGIVQNGDIVRIGNHWARQPATLGYGWTGFQGLLSGPSGWIADAPTNATKVRVYRSVALADERIENAWALGQGAYGYARIFRITAGTNGTVTIQNDAHNAGARPAVDCYFDAADKLFAPGDATSTGRSFTVSSRGGVGGSLVLAVAGVDFTTLVGQYVVILGQHDPETGRRRTATVDPASIAAGATLDVDVTVTGADPAVHHLNWQPPALTAGLAISFVRVKATDTLTIRLHNTTGSAIDEPSGTWAFWLMR